MRILAVILILAAIVAAESGKNSSPSRGAAPSVIVPSGAVPSTAAQNRAVRVEGEKRFRTNCGRCQMATIVRHMRVRALITDEDMRYILAYMTQ
jgi:cytochrome c5